MILELILIDIRVVAIGVVMNWYRSGSTSKHDNNNTDRSSRGRTECWQIHWLNEFDERIVGYYF